MCGRDDIVDDVRWWAVRGRGGEEVGIGGIGCCTLIREELVDPGWVCAYEANRGRRVRGEVGGDERGR